MTDPKPSQFRAALRDSGAFALFLAIGLLISRGSRRGWGILLDPVSLAGALMASLVVSGIFLAISIGVRSLLVHRPVKRHAEEESQDGR